MRETYRFPRVFIILFCVLFLLSASIPIPSSAEQEKVIRVGWFYQPGYQEIDEKGQLYGYNYEYLMQLAQYTGWRYKFVKADSMERVLKLLQQGEIDMMGCLIYTDERSETLAYPRISSGNAYTSLFVKQDSTIAPYDFQMFDGMRIACNRSQNPVDLLDYAKENEFTVEPVYYESAKAIEEAVVSGAVDGGILGGYQCSKDTRIVAGFAPTPFYFAVTKNNAPLLKELSRALEAVQIDNPFYEKDLSYKYLIEIKDSAQLTQEELEYVKARKPILVSYHSDWAPLEEKNADTGKFAGICADVFQRLSELSGLTFKYEADNTEKNIKKHTEGTEKAEIIAGYAKDFSSADGEGYRLTKSFLSVPLTVVWKTGHGADEEKGSAVFEKISIHDELEELYPAPLVFYKSEADCINSVMLGETSRAYVSTYTAERLLAEREYRTLQSTILHGIDYDLSIAVRDDLDPIIYSILSKALGQIPDSEMTSIIRNNTTITPEINLRTLIEQMPAYVIGLGVVLLTAVIVILILLLHARTRYALKIRELLYTDELTGFLSYKGFIFNAEKMLSANTSTQYYILDFDINSFEEYNTINGFDAGNKLLQQIADFLKEYQAGNEICARIQADHFVCLTAAVSLEEMENRIKEGNARFRALTENPSLLISYGIYEIQDKSLDISYMRDCAVQAKRTVKGSYEKYIAIYDEALHKKQIENAGIIGRFEEALEAGELVPYFQPQYDTQNQKIVGAEALVRWLLPEGGMIPPDRFIELLERNALISKLDLFMFEQACRKIKELMGKGKGELSISVNLSRAHLYNTQLLESLLNITKKYDVSPQMIVIELTETAFIDNQYELIRVMDRLHKAGFLVAMDDFGSGFSSLNMLKDIEFDIIKIDRGFLSTTSGTRRGETVIQNILSLAKALELDTVAEGVETKEQFDFLRENGCAVVQGYYFSKPVPEETFDRMIAEMEAKIGKPRK